MKLPSIHYLLQNAKSAFIRFPLTIIASLIATILGVYLTEMHKSITNILPYLNTMLCASLGIPLYFCVTIVANKIGFRKNSVTTANSIATVVLAVLYCTLPNAESTHNTSVPYIKYTIYNITCHLLVSFVPFIFSKQINGFWHYNKILFIRFLTSMLYSGFIYTGLAIALTSLRLLFDIKIHEELYVDMFIVAIGFFNTWFFVGGIPKDFDPLDTIYEYPKGLRIFAQYVLMPLLGLYLIILYTYGSKILISWNWPKGIVAYLIICVSILGIFAFLLLYPYGRQKDNAWIKIASRGYYWLLFPLLIILFIAIFIRINEYGITISRYIILALGIWLTIVCTYTAFGKTNIKFIPVSLAFLLIITSFGPWGMFSVSEQSQVNRLKRILERSNILTNSKIQRETVWIKDSLPQLYESATLANEGRLTDSIHNEVYSILNYLDTHHGFSSIRNWYQQDVEALVNRNNKNKKFAESEANIYMRTMGLKYEYIYTENKEDVRHFTSEENHNSIKKVSGYDYFYYLSFYNYNSERIADDNLYIDSVKYQLEHIDNPTHQLLFTSKTDTLRFDLTDLLKNLKKDYQSQDNPNIPASKMQIMGVSHALEAKIDIRSITTEFNKNQVKLNAFDGDVYIKKR